MLSISLLVPLLAYRALAVPIGSPTALSAADAPAITPSPSTLDAQQAAMSASISSLLDRLKPPPSIISELTAFPTSLLSALEGPNVVPVWQSLASDKPFSWFTALPSGAESWVLGLPNQAATILPQVISLQSLANNVVSTVETPPSSVPAIVTPTATITSTSTASAKNGLTQGETIGAIVGSAAVAALLLTVGFLLYDARKKKGISKTFRTHNDIRNANPPLISLANLRNHRKHRVASSATAATESAELGPDYVGHDESAYRGDESKAEEIHELHSPVIGY